MQQENVEIVRNALRRMTENGFAGIVGLLAGDFTMDSPHGVELASPRQEGAEEWFGKMEEADDDACITQRAGHRIAARRGGVDGEHRGTHPATPVDRREEVGSRGRSSAR